MTAYLIRRLLQMIGVIFVVSLFMFFLFNIAPGGPLTGLQQQQRRISPEKRRASAPSMSWTSTGPYATCAG